LGLLSESAKAWHRLKPKGKWNEPRRVRQDYFPHSKGKPTMATRTILCGILGVALLGALSGHAADKPDPDALRDTIIFRAVDTRDGRMIQLQANKATFLVPYIIVPPGGKWPQGMQGEIRVLGDTLRWSHGKEVTRGKMIATSSSAPGSYIDWVD
jgi:hypothetical protein